MVRLFTSLCSFLFPICFCYPFSFHLVQNGNQSQQCVLRWWWSLSASGYILFLWCSWYVFRLVPPYIIWLPALLFSNHFSLWYLPLAVTGYFCLSSSHSLSLCSLCFFFFFSLCCQKVVIVLLIYFICSFFFFFHVG